jgi:hypothetical protein
MGILWGWSMLTEMLFVARFDFSPACSLSWVLLLRLACNLLGLFRGPGRQTVTNSTIGR